MTMNPESIRIPFLNGEMYDGDYFLTYYERKGLEKADIFQEDPFPAIVFLSQQALASSRILVECRHWRSQLQRLQRGLCRSRHLSHGV